MHDTFDILVIGGGINGAGIVRDASGRNLKVCLVEKKCCRFCNFIMVNKINTWWIKIS